MFPSPACLPRLMLKRGVELIDMRHASLDPPAGRPPPGQGHSWPQEASRQGEGVRGLDTTTCLVVDKDGNLVAATPSGWSGVVAGEYRAYGWARGCNRSTSGPATRTASRRGSGRRITLTPTIVTKDGKPVMA